MQFVQALLGSPVGRAFAIIGGVLFLWAQLIKVFAYTVKELSDPTNKAVLLVMGKFIKERARKVLTPPLMSQQLSRSQVIAHWLTAGVYSLFVAWFVIYGICVLALGLLKIQEGVGALALIVMAYFLLACAKYFHKHARYLHSALCNLANQSTR